MVAFPTPPDALTERGQQVMNWTSEEIDANIKLGDKIVEILTYLEAIYDSHVPQ
jgi:hypothetical protein